MTASSTAAVPTGRVVVELGCGVTVYPARYEGDRWRAVWVENGRRRQCESMTEDGLARRLEPVLERLMSDAPHLERPGADLVAFYLCPDRLPVADRWSRKHTDSQGRLCERFVLPVIEAVVCQDITVAHMQEIVNAPATAGEGDRVRRVISALVSAGISGGYLLSPRLREVHWQAAGRPLPEPRVTVAGESGLFVDAAEIPSAVDVARLGVAMAAGRRGNRNELMAQAAAYSGLRWGEIAALTVSQVDPAGRVITVDRKVVEVGGHLFVEAPKNRKRRRTVYPRVTPAGYSLAGKLAARVDGARTEQASGANPLGLVFPSSAGKHWRSSNFRRRVLAPAYQAAGWRNADGQGLWTWHSLRHVFCTTALFTWKLDATDVSRMAGHANYRITLDMYVGSTAGILARARTATQ
jgi:integrase